MSAAAAINLSSVWQSLSLDYRIFILLLGALCAYSLFVDLRALSVLRSVSEKADDNRILAALRKRLWNLRQLHLAAFCLFGFCVVIQIPDAFRVVVDSYDIPFSTIARSLSFIFDCDAVIFVVFLFLHVGQWFASARAESRMADRV